MNRRYSVGRLLPRTGGRFIVIILAIAQVVSLLGAVPGILSIWVNQFGQAQRQVLLIAVPLLMVASIAILLVFGWYVTSTAGKRLELWTEKLLRPDRQAELADAIATALVVAGPERADAWATRLPGVVVMWRD